MYLGYWQGDYGIMSKGQGSNLSPDAIVAISYSAPAILTAFILGITASLVPILLALRREKSGMISGGSNSLVLSAACHAFVNAELHAEASSETGDQDQEEDESQALSDGSRGVTPLQALAQQRLRWGVVPMPPDLADILGDRRDDVEHLSFGNDEQSCVPPREDGWYV
jgi:hypothetical protein